MMQISDWHLKPILYVVAEAAKLHEAFELTGPFTALEETQYGKEKNDQQGDLLVISYI